MNEASEALERLWEDLLSRQPVTIKAAFDSLSPSDRDAVITHLTRMATEAGWQPEQRLSARAALEVLLSEPR